MQTLKNYVCKLIPHKDLTKTPVSHYFLVHVRQTQWDPPTWEGSTDNTSVDHESEMDLGTPTYDENPSKVSFYHTTWTKKLRKGDIYSRSLRRSVALMRNIIIVFVP